MAEFPRVLIVPRTLQGSAYASSNEGIPDCIDIACEMSSGNTRGFKVATVLTTWIDWWPKKGDTMIRVCV
jgi:hypothetical protein